MVFPHNQFPQIHLGAPSDPIRRQLLYNASPMICNIAEKAEIAYTTMVIEKWRLYNETICPCASIDPFAMVNAFRIRLYLTSISN